MGLDAVTGAGGSRDLRSPLGRVVQRKQRRRTAEVPRRSGSALVSNSNRVLTGEGNASPIREVVMRYQWAEAVVQSAA